MAQYQRCEAHEKVLEKQRQKKIKKDIKLSFSLYLQIQPLEIIYTKYSKNSLLTNCLGLELFEISGTNKTKPLGRDEMFGLLANCKLSYSRPAR